MFENEIAVVTGGESGIGAACVAELVSRGAKVVFTYFSNADEAARSQAAAGGESKAVFVQCDVSSETQVEALFARCEAVFGPATLLVNSAGRNMSGVKLVDMPLSQFDGVQKSDLYGPFLTCRRFVRALAAKGAKGGIVNISSIHESAARAGGVDYDSAKGGLRQLTRTLALELAPSGVRVNGVAPGMILTPMNSDAEKDPTVLKERESHIPMGRAGRSDEVAKLVAFLLSPEADYITGATVVIDGALSLVDAPGA